MPDPDELSYASSTKLTFEQRRWQIQILVVTYFGYIGYYFSRKVFNCLVRKRDCIRSIRDLTSSRRE